MARYDFTTQRLFVENGLFEGQAFALCRNHANYLLNVLRMKSGDAILLFNGRDGEWLAELVGPGRKSSNVLVTSNTRHQPAPYDLVYAFAPLKKGRMEYIVQKAVEMGAGVLQPVITQYTQNSKLNHARLNANIIEAAEQCGILCIPELSQPVQLDALIDQWDIERTMIFCDETSKKMDLNSELQNLRSRKLALLIGPEGGFSNVERERLSAMDCTLPISLGPRILRADTAGVAALAVVQNAAGDW